MERIKSQPVTEQDINDWADEAEQGYDVDRLRKRGRKPLGDGPARVVPVRIDDTLLAALGERGTGRRGSGRARSSRARRSMTL